MAEINEKRLKRIFAQLMSRNDALIPQSKQKDSMITDGSWDSYNKLISELIEMTGEKDFENYLVKHKRIGGIDHIMAADFSTNVYQAVRLIYDLYAEDYDIGDREPLSPLDGLNNTSSPSFHLNQTQNTDVRIEFNVMHQFITEKVIEAKPEYEDGSKEKTFLESVKEAVNLAKNTSDILVTILQLAAKYGIAADDLAKIFS